MSPKSLLRHPNAHSRLAELETGSFRTVIDDPEPPEHADTLIFCSGKVFYDLAEYRRAHKIRNTAIIRIEQLYPWDHLGIRQIAARYIRGAGKPAAAETGNTVTAGATRFVWAQEESRNRGAWRFVQNRLAEIVGVHNIEYAGRPATAAPATGSFSEHQAELDELLRDAFTTPDGDNP